LISNLEERSADREENSDVSNSEKPPTAQSSWLKTAYAR
jgi:hypothetical protein